MSKSNRFERARYLNAEYGTDWATAFRLAGGQKVNGDDYDDYLLYQENLRESPYLFGHPSRAFKEC